MNGRFRNDLFHRFASKINVSSLRDRKEDIPLLAYYFLDKYSNKNNAKIESISHEAMKKLIDYNWHGNIRELESCIETAIARNAAKITLFPHDFPALSQEKEDDAASKEEECEKIKNPMERAKCKEIIKAIKSANWNISEAARRLGISHAGIHRKIIEYGIRRPMKRV